MTGNAIDADEPTARNSNLLPVNANGDVRLRSVLSFIDVGQLGDAELDHGLARRCSPPCRSAMLVDDAR